MDEQDWKPLDDALAELDRRGGEARFWWRDDDAIEETPALHRLLDLAQRFRAPILLAVIPAHVQNSLRLAIGETDLVVPAVHGFAHANHAGAGEKKQELGMHRDPATVLQELSDGFEQLSDLFGDRLVPVLVPPWNRIAGEIAAELPGIGFRGHSVFGPEEAVAPVPGLTVVNTHLDPIDWHGSRSLVDPAVLIGYAAAHVRACADGEGGRVFGLLTHHLVQDDAIWTFVETLLARTAGHRGVRWCAPQDLFGR